MRELRQANRNQGNGDHGVLQVPEIGERRFEYRAVVETWHNHHLTVELNSARCERRQLLHDVGHARIVEQDFARVPRRGVHRDVERRQPVLDDARDVALFHV